MQYKEYLKFATKIAYQYKRHLDEDCISDIFNALVLANNKWDGRGEKNLYMAQQGKYAAMRYLDKLKNQVKMVDIYNILQPSSDLNPVHEAIRNESIEKLSSILNDNEYKCITMRFLDNMKLQEIGDILGCTRENVRLIINKAINKTKASFGE